MLGTTVAIGLGSNLGSSLENLRKALAKLKNVKNSIVIAVSSVFESEAQMPNNAPSDWNKKYLNAVVLMKFKSCDPLELLQELKGIESDLGRRSSETWAPREIDLDILFWDQPDFDGAQLKIPHARLLERPFALLPLLQVWPEVRDLFKSNLPPWSQAWIGERPFQTKISKSVWPRLVGILNVTPDSFSDGGRLSSKEDLITQLQSFKNSGVKIIDIGGESTRPQAKSVSLEEEIARLTWAFATLRDFHKENNYEFEISLDCRHSEVASHIVANYQVDYLNDVTGFDSPGMQKLLCESGTKAFVMHSLGVPPSKDNVISDRHSPSEVLTDWWKIKSAQLEQLGIESNRLVFDPGIGFGKSARQSMNLLTHLADISDIKNEVMIGHSRKSFLNLISERPAAERDLETAMVTEKLNLAYVQYLRVHSPESQLLALRAKGSLL